MAGLIEAIAGGEPTPPSPGDDFWYQDAGPVSNTGVRVTPKSAMKASACYACVMVLAQTIGAASRYIYRRIDDDEVELAYDHPLQRVLNRKPNNLQTAVEFWEMQVAFGALFGNSYARIVPAPNGQIQSLEPLMPTSLQTEMLSTGRLRYRYTDPLTGRSEILLQDEVFRIPGFSFNGVEGIAPIVFANDPIGLALATEMFSAKFFKSDATPALVLEHPKVLSPGAAERIRTSFKDKHAGLNNSHSVAVLEEGMMVKVLGKSNRDSQFLEQRRFLIGDIARFFRIPPHMVGDLEKSSFSNIEQQSIEFVRYTLKPWMTRIEQRVDTDLIEAVSSDEFFLKHDIDDMLKGEIAPRYGAYSQAITAGWMTRNEVRRNENMNPLPGLDAPLTPVNLAEPGSVPIKPEPAPEPKKKAAAMSTAHATILTDAIERVIGSEISGAYAVVKKHADGALAAKLEAFYSGKVVSYATKTLTPFEKMAAELGHTPPAASTWAAEFAAQRGHALIQSEDPLATLEAWEAEASATAQTLTTAYITAAQGDTHV